MIESQRILVCLRYGIGDALMEMPALRGLRAAYPAAELCLLGARPALQLFEDDADFQALVCIHDFGFSHWGDSGDREARDAFARWFRQADFNWVLDPFHAVFGVQELLINNGVPWRNASPIPRIPPHLAGGHGIASIWNDAVDAWRLDNQRGRLPPAPRPHLPTRARRTADKFLADWGWSAADKAAPVGIAPIASSHLKRWPLERVLEVVRWLIHERARRIVIFGVGDDQSQLLERLRGAAPRDKLAVLAPTHLQDTAALAARCRAFVSNDTGLMHMAAAVGTPTLGLFGPTAAHIYLPYASLAVGSERSCSYRLQEQFGPPQCVHAGRCLVASDSCINTITTNAVTTALDKLLGHRRFRRISEAHRNVSSDNSVRLAR